MILDDSNRKTNNILVHKGGECYHRSMKSWLQDDDTEMYSTHNKEKYVVAARFITTLMNRI